MNGVPIVTSTGADFHKGMSIPFVFHRQLADLRLQVLHARSLGATLLGGRGKYVSGTLEKLGFPLRDLLGVDIEALRELRERQIAFEGSQGNLRFES